MTQTVVVTGANQGLGYALVSAIARRLGPAAHVYLTGRDEARVRAAADSLADEDLRVLPERLDVQEPEGPAAFAEMIASRHGAVDLVVSNAAARLSPDRSAADQVATFVDTNNLGTTRMIRALGPLLVPAGRFLVVASSFGTLRSLPRQLHRHFDTDRMSLDDVDRVMRDYVTAVEEDRAQELGWPGWINIASKVGQVAAARVFARTSVRGAQGTSVPGSRGERHLVAAVCPGLVDTGASRPWFDDMGQAQSPDEAAEDVVELALGPVRHDVHGELVQHRRVLPWR